MSSDMRKTEGTGMVRRESMTQRLTRERDQAQARVDQLNDALDRLAENPQVQEVIDVLSKITHF